MYFSAHIFHRARTIDKSVCTLIYTRAYSKFPFRSCSRAAVIDARQLPVSKSFFFFPVQPKAKQPVGLKKKKIEDFKHGDA